MFSKRRIRLIARFIAHEAGALALSFAIAAPAMLVVAGVATDYAFLVRYRTELQAVADAAAIAGARELSLAQTQTSQVGAVVQNFVNANAVRYSGSVTVKTNIAPDGTSVDVTLSRVWAPFFAQLISDDVTPIVASSTATLIGSTKVCVVGLDETANDTVYLTDKAMMTANGCAVYVNSTSSQSLYAGSSATLNSLLTCTAGGYYGTTSAFSPAPLTDCPKISDPLADRAPPSFSGCDYKKSSYVGVTATLLPGTYCSGINIDKGANVTFSPGVYVINGGSFTVGGNSTINGTNVGFYLTGKATFTFKKDSTVTLSAPKDGALAGILFFEDRNNPADLTNKITSDDARTLIGTIYLSQGFLKIDSNKPVADQSAYTAIVARSVKLQAGPNLVLNSNYDGTDVPVPSGLKNLAGSRIALTK